jgi:ribosomal protein S18
MDILQKDDMGLKTLAYNLHDKAGQDTAYICSYYVQAPSSEIIEFKKQLVYNKAIKRYVVYKMHAKQPMFVFNDLQEELEKIITSWDEKKVGQKLSFFANKKNSTYLDWKAIPMLKKYITRFGNIKPRKYTGNSVSIQKKLREVILRAKELGLIEYVRD